MVPFTYPGTDVVVQQLTPTAATYEASPLVSSGEGDVTGTVIPIDLNLTGDRANTSGCEASDFAGLDFAGTTDIALVQRGTCGFTVKANLAAAAGAEAVIVFNQGDGPDRSGPLTNVTAAPFDFPAVPLATASFDAGAALAVDGATARVSVASVDRVSHNVVAELAGRTDGNVVMAGAHLDSVPAGPGINDNGSGSAALLELAENMGKSRPKNTVRLAWWGAEELGLIGSTEWVGQRTPAELDEIALYLNFDMIGSPNYYFGIYDADQSSFAAPVVVPEGSEHIEKTFEEFYTLLGEPYDDSAYSGRSDYQAFIENGIPSGGLFTGAEGIKTAEQQAVWGGTTGAQYDPCYHIACDSLANIDRHALEVNSDAVAYAVFTYAASTEPVNGVRGTRLPGNFPVPAPAGPAGTFVGESGGDEHDHDAAGS
ncbi:M20/M25/M40 family metallo-hydrolase [Cellulomonas sp. ATA003]|uniref:M20/M25/M40 family metallo-hydrolase n=1 Tax=Cellulomonas sp. ATA003 TaxID=3073064 RepID=UPI002873BE5F|nr:M20/M25/M40 family metallo-hydrolase [Cellulomonas sp. ATA003]WNB87440.1 M20/M25/M40 family metallo-hydrolase [Cellulomonas sp. ATA003]